MNSIFDTVPKEKWIETFQKVIDKCNLFFVYGTLQQEFGNGRRLLSHCTYDSGYQYLEGNYQLMSSGCPFLIENPSSISRVRGQSVTITDLITVSSLDRLESEGQLYHRVLKKLVDGRECWVYMGDFTPDYHFFKNEPSLFNEELNCYHWPKENY